MEYRRLVLELLSQKKYPVLHQYVYIDVFFKMIPTNVPLQSLDCYRIPFDNPEDVYGRDAKPFDISYVVKINPETFYLHRVAEIRTESYPLQCIPIKLQRSLLDKTVLRASSPTFEEELYQFLTLLNFDVPRIAPLINLSFAQSTRFLPQYVTLRTSNYTVENIESCPLGERERSWFGPPSKEEVIPTRLLRGRLSECTSRSKILSLNNNAEAPSLSYTQHFSEQWNALFPLAFNPLENPIILI